MITLRAVLLLVCLSILSPLHAQQLSTPHIRLWDKDAPGALGTEEKDIPTVDMYLTAEGVHCSTAIVICPGGGYGGLAGHEGVGYARILAEQGITCFVLTYRLGSKGYHHPAMLQDVARAIRFVRSRAKEYGIDPTKIGVMGSSAGGHLASTILTHFDAGKPDDADPIERESSRPDFGVLCYAVISMQDGLTHAGSKKNLLGDNPDPALVDLLSNEKQVTPQTPPCFIWHTGEDKAVKVENAIAFAQALQANHVPYDLHIYQKGPHGLGMDVKRLSPALSGPHPWVNDLFFWLRQNNWLPDQSKTASAPAAATP